MPDSGPSEKKTGGVMFRSRLLLISLTIVLAVTAVAFSQVGEKEKIKRLTPTSKGSTGFFKLAVADTLRAGEFSVSFNVDKFNRDPGDLDFTIFPVTFTVGLHDRIELFASYEVYKRVNADGIFVNTVQPGTPVQPTTAPRSVGVDFIPTVAYFNDTPFMDVGFGDGSGDLWAGLKLNLLSERRGDAVGFAIQPIARFHLTDDREHLSRGLTSGVTDAGFDVILSKNFGGGGTFTGNAGFLFADDLRGVDRQPSFNWGFGLGVPLGGKVDLLGEVAGRTWYGSRRAPQVLSEQIPPGTTLLPGTATDQFFVNARSPVDIYGGLRIYPARWIVVSGGANVTLNRMNFDDTGLAETDYLGFWGQVALQRKINEPPTIECAADSRTVTEGDTLRITPTVVDPDDDTLTIQWTASGGTVTEQGNVAVFDSTGLDPGTYTIRGEVSDGEHTAVCTVDVTVEKRRLPPTISCDPSTMSVTEGESITLQARASDPNDDALTYSWTVNGQSVTNDRPEFEFGTAGRQPGQYTVRVTVTDVDNMSASCEFTVTVNRRPNNNPTVTLSLDRTEVFTCEPVTATATAQDPDGDPLTYSWTLDGQSISGTGSTVPIDTCDLAGGTHTVTVTVNDGRGGTASDTVTFNVTDKTVIPTDRIQPDNKAKAQLDEIALKMQQNPQLRARITGHTDDRGSERVNERVGERRAQAAKDYLVNQHNIEGDRIEVASAGETSPIADNTTAEGRKQNRRIEVELFVPRN